MNNKNACVNRKEIYLPQLQYLEIKKIKWFEQKINSMKHPSLFVSLYNRIYIVECNREKNIAVITEVIPIEVIKCD